MTIKRKIIHIDEEKCDGCGLCIPSCAEGALEIVDGKAKLIAEKYCDGLGACLGECPKGAIGIIEREADEFDHAAVDEHMKMKLPSMMIEPPILPCGCSSSMVRQFTPAESCDDINKPKSQTGSSSSLSHWPVQIRLVPPTAPFLNGAHLLVAADCTAVAYPRFHQDFITGRVVLLGCLKFDDVQPMVEKFARIFHEADVASITVLVMEVPCCQGLPVIVQKGMEQAGKQIPLEVVVIGTTGTILN